MHASRTEFVRVVRRRLWLLKIWAELIKQPWNVLFLFQFYFNCAGGRCNIRRCCCGWWRQTSSRTSTLRRFGRPPATPLVPARSLPFLRSPRRRPPAGANLSRRLCRTYPAYIGLAAAAVLTPAADMPATSRRNTYRRSMASNAPKSYCSTR